MQPAVADTYYKHRNMVELYSRKPHISRDLWNDIETGRHERQSLKGKHKEKLNRVVTPPNYLETSEQRDLNKWYNNLFKSISKLKAGDLQGSRRSRKPL